MPILPAEPDMHPDDLWDLALDDEGGGRAWWCLHTKPRQEKATGRHLLSRGIGYYLPKVVREGRTPGGRKTRSTVPLFPGYVFMLGDERQRIEAIRGDTLAGVLKVADQAALARDLRQIHRMLGSGRPVAPEPSHPVGARVRIATGPLEGLVGEVVRRGRHDRFVATVSLLGCGASVDLHDWQVEGLDDAGPTA